MRTTVAVLLVALTACATPPLPPRDMIAAALPSMVQIEVLYGSCSGTAITATDILTNEHCVVPGLPHQVRLADGTQIVAEVLEVSQVSDLALLRVPGANFAPVQVAPPGSLAPGDTVYAIGQPFGLGWTVSRGVVSYLGRVILSLNNGRPLLQMDAAIHPGSSGGAVLDERGRLVGVAVGGRSSSAGHGIQLNFAVPADQIVEFLEATFADRDLTKPVDNRKPAL